MERPMQHATPRVLGFGAVLVLAAGCGEIAPEPVVEVPVSFAQALRPDDPLNGDLHTFDLTEVVETFDSPGGSFKVHFTRNGNNEVPSDDADGSGVPDFVEEVAAAYDEGGAEGQKRAAKRLALVVDVLAP